MFPEQSLAKLREKFSLDQTIGTSEPDLSSSSVNSQLCFSRQTLDTGSQTDISGEVSFFHFVKCKEKLNQNAVVNGTGCFKWLFTVADRCIYMHV